MKRNPVDIQRRNMLKLGALGAAATMAGYAGLSASQSAQRLDENDPQAQPSANKHDAAKVDKQKDD